MHDIASLCISQGNYRSKVKLSILSSWREGYLSTTEQVVVYQTRASEQTSSQAKIMSSSGIQTLLKAEKEAQEIVSSARAYRAQRLKSAKADAAKEIEAYKAQKDKELKDFETKYEGINATADSEAAETVKTEVANLKETATGKKQHVVKLLVDAVTDPKPELHINARI